MASGWAKDAANSKTLGGDLECLDGGDDLGAAGAHVGRGASGEPLLHNPLGVVQKHMKVLLIGFQPLEIQFGRS
jgi:hypothetical protein